jgi:nucleoside diphosphate kinase
MSVEFWQRHVFVLLCPDTVHRGLAGALLRRLRDEGFTPVAGRLAAADPETIDDLYADLIAGQWKTWRYRLVDAAFRLSPAIALICRYDPAGPEPPARPPHELLQERKGHQHPEQAAAGTIRRDLGAINAVLNLIHTGDGPAESEREAAVFGLTAEDARAGSGHPSGQLDYLCELTRPAVPENRDFAATLASVRAKILAAAWPSLAADVRDKLVSEFPEPDQMGVPDAGERLGSLLTGALTAELADVLRCDFTPRWRDRMRIGHATDRLRRYGATLDQWEELVRGRYSGGQDDPGGGRL